MGKRTSSSSHSTAYEKYGDIRNSLNGFTYSRTIMPSKATSHGGGITAIFKHAHSGQEKPIPYPRLKAMEETVKCALRTTRQLTKRDKQAVNCDDPVLSKIMTARQAADRARHSVRSLAYA